MKKILNTIFVVLGVIFFLLIMLAVCFFVFDPLNLKPLLFNESFEKEINSSAPAATTAAKTTENATTAQTTTTVIATSPPEGEGSDNHPFLNETQEKILEAFGVDVSTLPSELTPEMEECFIEKLGEQRVNEIIGGATPNPLDFFKAKSCLES